MIRFCKLFFFSVLLAVAFTACREDRDLFVDSPARHITESEKLIIPSAIELPVNQPGGYTRVATFYAEGVQKYKAKEKAGSSPVTYEWTLLAPDASLYDMTNQRIGTHTAGPTWQLLSSTTDSIYGQAFSPAKTAPSPEASSVDWLLLKPKDGKTPTGIFANVTFIQRIDTKGGKAPSTPPQHINETIDVPYTAVYRFTRKNQ